MHHRIALLALLTSSLTAIACDANDDPADVDSARIGWRSTELALAEAGVEPQWTATATVDEDGVRGMVTGTLPCPDGGKLDIASTGEVSGEQVSGEVEIEFHGCEADGVVIDGYLEYGAEVTETSVTATVSGELSFSGDAQGSCNVDLSASVSTDGVTTSSVGGHVCGFNYGEIHG